MIFLVWKNSIDCIRTQDKETLQLECIVTIQDFTPEQYHRVNEQCHLHPSAHNNLEKRGVYKQDNVQFTGKSSTIDIKFVHHVYQS